MMVSETLRYFMLQVLATQYVNISDSLLTESDFKVNSNRVLSITIPAFHLFGDPAASNSHYDRLQLFVLV